MVRGRAASRGPLAVRRMPGAPDEIPPDGCKPCDNVGVGGVATGARPGETIPDICKPCDKAGVGGVATGVITPTGVATRLICTMRGLVADGVPGCEPGWDPPLTTAGWGPPLTTAAARPRCDASRVSEVSLLGGAAPTAVATVGRTATKPPFVGAVTPGEELIAASEAAVNGTGLLGLIGEFAALAIGDVTALPPLCCCGS